MKFHLQRVGGGDLLTKKGDTYLSIPADLATKIKEIMVESYGSYESMSEFVRDAIRYKIEYIETMRNIRSK